MFFSKQVIRQWILKWCFFGMFNILCFCVLSLANKRVSHQICCLLRCLNWRDPSASDTDITTSKPQELCEAEKNTCWPNKSNSFGLSLSVTQSDGCIWNTIQESLTQIECLLHCSTTGKYRLFDIVLQLQWIFDWVHSFTCGATEEDDRRKIQDKSNHKSRPYLPVKISLWHWHLKWMYYLAEHQFITCINISLTRHKEWHRGDKIEH